ncbi:MAG: hypothetical protein JKY49_00535 [Cohaesibacteraceae bacterium]|nr:hypothetical protein [Cohaesibacteraceae bacterium]MBL4876201.1 hypothetical protein [Cohaesibacteraceae bacterium]
MQQNQVSRLWNHLRDVGSISVREAMLDLHINSLSRRICDLQLRGPRIPRVMKENPATGERYMRYYHPRFANELSELT